MKRIKKYSLLFFFTCLLFNCFSFSAYAAEKPFADISENDRYYESIVTLYEKGILGGKKQIIFARKITLPGGNTLHCSVESRMNL